MQQPEEEVPDDMTDAIPLCKVKRKMLSWQLDESLCAKVPVVLGLNAQFIFVLFPLTPVQVATGSFSPIHLMHGEFCF